MILKKGDNIFVAHRRLFDGDAPRFFVGQVDDYEVGVVKARGYSYVWDEMSGLMHGGPRKPPICDERWQRGGDGP
jgi:hypothetical protein